jgi:LysR family transcriptional regulator, transcriptional activator of the cysJI operon
LLDIRKSYDILVLVPVWEFKLFREIAQARSMTRGAAQCGISQSAASQHVQEVERRLGVTLLDRAKRPLGLTPAGRLYLELCRDVVRRDELFLRDLEALQRDVTGTVRVASIYSIGITEMSGLQDEFAARFPNATLVVDYMRPDKIYEAVLDDRADLGLVSYPEPSRQLAAIGWRDEQMHAALAPSHPLARLTVLEPRDLAGQDYVGFDEDLRIRREIDRFLRSYGVEVNLVMHFDNIQMIKEAVALGTGLAILPARTMLAEVAQGRLVSIPLLAPGLVRPVGIVHRKKRAFGRAAEGFIELLLAGPDLRVETATVA